MTRVRCDFCHTFFDADEPVIRIAETEMRAHARAWAELSYDRLEYHAETCGLPLIPQAPEVRASVIEEGVAYVHEATIGDCAACPACMALWQTYKRRFRAHEEQGADS